MTPRSCTRCATPLTAENTKRDRRKANGLSSWCRDCHLAATIAWQQANPERLNAGRRARYAARREEFRETRRANYDPEQARWAGIWRRYKLTRQQYEALDIAQDHRCAICREPHVGRGPQLHVDHDHSTGQIRGLLCSPCNTALHKLETRPGWIDAANDYLTTASLELAR